MKPTNEQLYLDVKQLIDTAKQEVSQTVNSTLTLLYWNIGKRINEEVLKDERAEYGKNIIINLARQLSSEFGKGFTKASLSRMCNLNLFYPDISIVATLSQQLSWSHFIELIPIKNDIERNFYTQLCRVERWSVRTLRDKKRSMLFERTAISKKPDELARLELENLERHNTISPDLVFRNPYILDFLNLKDTYQEKDLETAILRQIEGFILELGKGFAFLERQKRMIIDRKDFKLDLLFYHRKLKRLVAN